jgi:hypothetical protein
MDIFTFSQSECSIPLKSKTGIVSCIDIVKASSPCTDETTSRLSFYSRSKERRRRRNKADGNDSYVTKAIGNQNKPEKHQKIFQMVISRKNTCSLDYSLIECQYEGYMVQGFVESITDKIDFFIDQKEFEVIFSSSKRKTNLR